MNGTKIKPKHFRKLKACPGPPGCSCERGRVDSGGVTPWGAPIYLPCPICAGTGQIAEDQIDQEFLADKLECFREELRSYGLAEDYIQTLVPPMPVPPPPTTKDE